MVHTDFVNVAAPSFWDEAQSGVLATDWYVGSGTESLVDVKTKRTGTLADIWSGTRYEAYGQQLLFQFPVAIELSELWTNMLDDAGYSGMWLYGVDDALLFAGPRASYENPSIDVTDEFGSLISRVYKFTWPTPAVIKAIVLDDVNNYPQGRPGLLYGIYGTQLAGDPPPPPPFWTNFVKSSELRA